MVVLWTSSQPQGARPPIPVPPCPPGDRGRPPLPASVADCVDSLKGLAAFQQNFATTRLDNKIWSRNRHRPFEARLQPGKVSPRLAKEAQQQIVELPLGLKMDQMTDAGDN
jgi:hypothetical protein